MINGDSWDYDLIDKGVELSKGVQGACLEIGLRMGGGTKHIIDSIATHSPGKIAIAIDPYGSILYEHKEKHFVRLDYTEEMKAECLSLIYPYALSKGVQFYFINMSDEDFFDYYKHGVPIYNIERKEINKYSFVHFDGPHSLSSIMVELDYFIMRIDVGACFCFDDVSRVDKYYDHDKIEEFLFLGGFKLIEKRDKKALYQYENSDLNSRHGAATWLRTTKEINDYIGRDLNSFRNGHKVDGLRGEDPTGHRVSEIY